MNWMRQHLQRAKDGGYAELVLARYKLGMKAGGAIRGVRVLAATDSCPTCLALADRVYDPDTAPLIPADGCTSPGGCRCSYAPVMTYEQRNWQLDHRPKGPEYAESVLSRLRLATRAGGAIAGVKIVTAQDSCPTCVELAAEVYRPDVAPRIPIATCSTIGGCRCAYSTAMAYAIPCANPVP